MPQLVIAPSFLEGQYHALQILSGNIITDKPYTNNTFIEEFLRDLIVMVQTKDKLNTITDGESVDQKMLMLDSIVKSFTGNAPEFDERVAASISWTILSQALYTNEFFLDEYSEMLRDILGKLI